jgi:hypothetical protein
MIKTKMNIPKLIVEIVLMKSLQGHGEVTVVDYGEEGPGTVRILE